MKGSTGCLLMAVIGLVIGAVAVIGGGDMYTQEIITCVVGCNVCLAIEGNE